MCRNVQGYDHPNAMPLLQYLFKLEGYNQHIPKAFLYLQISGFKVVKILNLNTSYTPLIWKIHCHKDEYRAVPLSSCNVERFLFWPYFVKRFNFPKGLWQLFRIFHLCFKRRVMTHRVVCLDDRLSSRQRQVSCQQDVRLSATVNIPWKHPQQTKQYFHTHIQ